MPDIELRFNRDMLVLTSPLHTALASWDLKPDEATMYCVTEPEAVEHAMRLQSLSGAACFVLPTKDITQARLAHLRLADQASEIVQAAFTLAKPFRPQHLIAEIGATGLPIDETSQTSLKANRDQYANAVELFEDKLDAYLFTGLASIADLRCALMGARKKTALPIFASLAVDEQGRILGREESIDDAIEVAEDYEADVLGLSLELDDYHMLHVLERVASRTTLPILVQLPLYRDGALVNYMDHPDSLMQLALSLRSAGAQFLQACGEASSLHAGALVAATEGLDALRGEND